MSGVNDKAEALIRLVGEDAISALADSTNAKLKQLVSRQKESTAELDRQRQSVLTLGEHWATLSSGLNASFQLIGQFGSGLRSAAEAIKEAVQDQAVTAEFGRHFGTASEKLERLREASRGMLADAALQRMGSQAARAGLDLEQTTQLIAASTRAAVGSGRDIAEVGEAVLASVVEQNDEAAKQLGLHVDMKAAAESYAASIGAGVEQLTAAQRVASALNETSSAIGAGFAEVTGAEASTRLAQLESRWTNLAATMKGFLADRALAVVDAFTGESADQQATAAATKNVNALVDVIVRGRDTLTARMAEFRTDAEMLAIAGAIVNTRQYAGTLEALQVQLDRTGQKAAAADVVLKNLNWDPARIEAAQFELRSLGDALGALKLEEAARAAASNRRQIEADTAAAVEFFERWSGGISGVFEEQRDRTMDLLQARLEQGRAAEQATAATLADLSAQARLAEQLGLTTQANRIWDEATRLASSGQVDLTKNIVALELALRGSNNQAARAALLQAQLATAFFDTAAAAKAQQRAADLLAAGAGAKGGGGGGPSRPKLTDELQPATQKSVSDAAARAYALQDAAASAAEDRAWKATHQRQAGWLADAQEQLKQQEDQRQALLAGQASGFQSAAASADVFGASLRDLAGIDLGPLGASVGALDPLVTKMREMASATNLSHSAMVSGTAGIVAGAGKITAGLIKNETARAAVMALVETAEGIGAMAIGDYVGGGLHFASAAMYSVVAGMSAGGGGAGSKGRSGGSKSRDTYDVARLPSTASQPSAPASPVSYTIYMAGATIIGADDQQVGRHMTRVLDEHASRSAGSRSAGPR